MKPVEAKWSFPVEGVRFTKDQFVHDIKANTLVSLDKTGFPFFSGFGLESFPVYSGFGLDRFSVYSGFGLDRFCCTILIKLPVHAVTVFSQRT